MTTQVERHLFLSHNSADKGMVEGWAGALSLLGAQVWFDSWSIRPGDSIPGAINEGLAQFDTFVLAWSESASESRWVKTEMESAINRIMGDEKTRLVPVVLDDSPLPPLIAHLKYINGDQTPIEVARQLLGINDQVAVLKAIQHVLDYSGIEVREFYGAGVYVCCPKCGASADTLEGFQSTDYDNDRMYAGAQCRGCGWSDGGEI